MIAWFTPTAVPITHCRLFRIKAIFLTLERDMGFDKHLKTVAVILSVAGALSAAPTRAATSIEGNNVEFTPDSAQQTLQARANSWYNLTMGYQGWAHHSAWGYMKLKKGKPVTIRLTAQQAGFHPAVTVWHKPVKKKLLDFLDHHFYSQFDDVYNPNVILDDDPSNPIRLGKLKMVFVANAFDRDGMADVLPAEYDQSMLNRALDGETGVVSLSFTPDASGYYQFVVGGINPDDGVPIDVNYDIDVAVSFP